MITFLGSCILTLSFLVSKLLVFKFKGKKVEEEETVMAFSSFFCVGLRDSMFLLVGA